MTEAVQAKLKLLPKQPGVYFHKNAAGEIIYVGKAAVLKNRVRQYFQNSRTRDPKTEALVAEIADIEWQETESEIDALFLEAELIRRYLPPYNILLRDDKSLSYVRIDIQNDHPTVTMTRRPLDDGAKYFGPYMSTLAVRRALKGLRRAYPYSTHTQAPKRACLQYHLGLCPGIEEHKTPILEYRANLRKLMQYMKGDRVALVKQAERDMQKSAKAKDFEAAAQYRNQMRALQALTREVIFSDKEFMDLSKDHAVQELLDILQLTEVPRRIEGYDISHMQGTDTVASMVVFANGVPDKASYRKFKMRIPGNDDFAHMREVLLRRFSDKHAKDWPRPQLLLIDGGKGQLGAAVSALIERGITIPAVGLAKREEEIIVLLPGRNGAVRGSEVAVNQAAVNALGGYVTESSDFLVISLPHSSHVIKLLQRIRDESHRFAVSYHSVLKTKRQTASLLDAVPTIGPTTRKKLLKTFGSVQGIMQARDFELEKTIGPKKAAILRQYIRMEKKHLRPR